MVGDNIFNSSPRWLKACLKANSEALKEHQDSKNQILQKSFQCYKILSKSLTLANTHSSCLPDAAFVLVSLFQTPTSYCTWQKFGLRTWYFTWAPSDPPWARGNSLIRGSLSKAFWVAARCPDHSSIFWIYLQERHLLTSALPLPTFEQELSMRGRHL